MSFVRRLLERWGAAALLMLAIYALSSRSPSELPNFGWIDRVVKDGGHVVGYGLLALSYWHAFRWKPRRLMLAWILAVFYGATDELHQTLVPGRHPSLEDLFLLDATGAALALLGARWISARNTRPSPLK